MDIATGAITAAERIALAAQLSMNEQYLYQCLSGRRAMDPAQAVRVERHLNGRVRRWQLRKADWHLIWPELIGAEGAPAVPADQSQEVRDAA